jgi:hypothetical protein
VGNAASAAELSAEESAADSEADAAEESEVSLTDEVLSFDAAAESASDTAETEETESAAEDAVDALPHAANDIVITALMINARNLLIFILHSFSLSLFI